MKIQTQQRRGFTLIELLTAVAITVVIIAVLIGMTRMTMDTWKESRDRARAASQAKEGLDILARDLEGAVIREGNDFEWFYVEMDSNGDPLGPNAGEIKNPIEFCFFTAATDRYDGQIGTPDDNGGDISTVVYRLVYKDLFNGDYPVYSLYRQLVNPDETFTNFLAKEDLGANVQASEVINAENFVAENIYNLSLTLVVEYSENVNGTERIVRKRVPVIDGGTYTEVSITGRGVKGAGGADLFPANTDARVVSAEIGMLVLNDTAMRSLENRKFNENTFKKMLKENSHYFTKSVLMSRP